MTPAARLSAAIGLLDEILTFKRPLASILKDWGNANRYAGSGDRNAVGNLVHDALRVKASAAWMMGQREPGSETGRAVLFGMLRRLRGMEPTAIAALCTGERFAPAPLSDAELAALEAASLEGAPAPVLGDYPDWLEPNLTTAFGEARVAEAAAMAARAPVDLRINALKIIRLKALEALGHLAPEPTPLSPLGLRLLPNAEGRVPHVQSEPAFLKGAVEIQDEGSQLVSLLAGAEAGQQVLDLCAGGGGKTLALAAEMNNKGQIFATDSDQRRLAPIHDRLTRAGVRNVQVRTPRNGVMPLDDLAGKMDLVLVDAPCTGAGTWRRHPDAKWRMRPNSLALRVDEQRAVLDHAAGFVRPGGRLVYITCSLLDEENGQQVRDFLARHSGFAVEDLPAEAHRRGLGALADNRDASGLGLLLTPHRTNTDGFFIAALRRTA
ncbi:MAG: RsmB/NOP family class I SAM-dependent RNA methyltransferase [Beijerinckiaceae bacterium]|nr:RsmB/NOP family class I SAM-dependent RNA methyltransferase [Beijerinckiaceae bacterium]MCZ8299905.1 RsmB/NOP family class I SAM-dependent RNA methyltransferase [Beijerinckiaceae bacterium]